MAVAESWSKCLNCQSGPENVVVVERWPLMQFRLHFLDITFNWCLLSAAHAINRLYSTDDDECAAVNGGCDHVCFNTNGSFACSCHLGYFLDSDGKTCRGRPLQGCFFAVQFCKRCAVADYE